MNQTDQTDQIDQTDHAIVIGGSIAGLMAARVLSDYFARVTVIERDMLPDTATARKGVPQARHLHNLVARGRIILDTLFPDFSQDMANAGATRIEWPADFVWLGRAGWSPRASSNLFTYSCSRPLLEMLIRRRVAALPNVTLLEGHDVIRLVTDTTQRIVQGVSVQTYPHDDTTSKTTQHLAATFVVDASGRTTKTPEWLATLGYQPPSETSSNPFVGYATRYFDIPPHVAHDTPWKVMLVQSRPTHHNRAMGMFQLEQNRWVVTLVGVGKDYPPTDEEGFLAFAQSLPTPLGAEFIQHATPVSPIHGYRITHNRLVHYENIRLPERFVVLGDAACSFNPTYGQGMSVTAEGIMVFDAWLKHALCRSGRGITGNANHVFQQQLATMLTVPWLFTTSEDSRYPTTAGARHDIATRLMQWHIDGIMLYAVENPEVLNALISVMHLVQPPETLLRPDFLLWSASLNLMNNLHT